MRRALVLTIISALILLTFSITYSWRGIVRIKEREFGYQSGRIVSVITGKLSEIENAASSFQAFFHAAEYIDPDEFRLYSEHSIGDAPSIVSLFFSPKIKEEDLESFIKERKYWGLYNYSIFAFDENKGKHAAIQKPYYYPILYAEPYSVDNIIFLGYEIFSNENLKSTCEKAIITGNVSYCFSDSVYYLAENQYALFVPIYEGKKVPYNINERLDTVYGIVSVRVNIVKLLDMVPETDDISFHIVPIDESDSHGSCLLANEWHKGEDQDNGFARLYSEYNINIGSQAFVISIQRQLKAKDFLTFQTIIINIVTLIIIFFVYLTLKNKEVLRDELALRAKVQKELSDYKDRLEDIVDDRTKELSEKNIELENEVVSREKAERELKETTSQLIQTEKLVSIGQLAASVAHEINTPLGAINSSNNTLKGAIDTLVHNWDLKLIENNITLIIQFLDRVNVSSCELSSREIRNRKKEIIAELLEKNISNAEDVGSLLASNGIVNDYNDLMPLFTMPDNGYIIEFLQHMSAVINGSKIIETAVAQSSKVVKALKDYARSDFNKEMVTANIRETIETSLLILGNKLKHGIELCTDLDEVPDILCFPNELSQVWSNLIQNAIQAMNNFGQLSITLKHIDYALVLTFTDSGPGIPADIIDKIFEPMFTTKPKGEGTGLGLDIARRIVAEHNGTIIAENTGEGVRFTVTLPVNC